MISGSLTPDTVSAPALPRSRFAALGLTRRGLLLFLAGALWLAPAFFIPKLAWGMAAWDLLILALAVLDAARLPSPRQITADRVWRTAPALAAEAEVELGFTQEGGSKLRADISDDLTAALVGKPPSVALTIYPLGRSTAIYRFTPRERGDHSTGRLYIRYRSAALGLIQRWAVAPLEQKVRVYPTVHPAAEQSLFLTRSKQIELQQRLQRQRGLGRDFESLREYREGDDIRDLCWTATARRGVPITRQYQTEKSQPVWLLLDAGRLLQARVVPPTRSGAPSARERGRVGLNDANQDSSRSPSIRERGPAGSTDLHAREDQPPYTRLDYATSTALALAQLALAGGDRVGLLAYGQSIQQRVPLGRGAAQMRQLMESLAQVRGESGEADHLNATVTLNRMQPRRSLVLWITDVAETSMRPEVIDGAAHLMRRHLLLFVAMRQSEMLALADLRPANRHQMFAVAAAQELAFRRMVLMAQLREQGALTLETEPHNLTAQVLNRYLDVKERALL